MATIQDSAGFQNLRKERTQTISEQTKTFEDLLHLIKPLGPWQFYVYALIILSNIAIGLPNFSVVYLNIAPKFSCLPGPMPNVNATTMLPDTTSTTNQNVSFGKCHTASGNVCEFFKYYPVHMKTTIVTEWNLVCNGKLGPQHGILTYAVGSLLSLGVTGRLADKFGRKTMVVVAQLLTCAFSIATAFAPTFASYLILRFFLGFFIGLYFTPIYVLGLEMANIRFRSIIGGGFWIPYSVGTSALGAIAYLLRDWRPFQVVISLPLLCVILNLWLLPESPRWLLVEGKVKRAEAIIRNAAKLNRVQLPADIDFDQISRNISDEAHREKAQRTGFVTLFSHRTLILRIAVLSYGWFACAFVFWSVSFFAGKLPASPFITNSLVAFVEIPGAMAAAISLTRFGRKSCFITFILTSGTGLLILPWLPDSMRWVIIALAMVGKAGAAAAWSVLFTYGVELFPTSLRSNAMAIASLGAAIGFIATPYIADLANIYPSVYWLPTVLMGAATIPAALLVLLLPETKGKRLPDHVDDLINEKK